MVKNGVVAMLFWANGVIFLLFLLGITSEWRNVLGIFYLQEFSTTVAATAMAVVVAVEGGCDCCLLYRIYYFIVMDILFYCNVYIILLC